MKVVILAGGFGTRLSEETVIKPKPMVEIGGKPILWHIMKIYSHYGFHDFVICLGYKGYAIKEYFVNYSLHMSDLTVDLKKNAIETQQNVLEPWKITLVDTGYDTMTGGRIKRIRDHVGDETFMLTYGDGVADVNIRNLLEFHKKKKKFATVTAIQPPVRFGVLQIEENSDVRSFLEKPMSGGGYVNGGFFVLEHNVFDYIENDSTVFERAPLEAITNDQQMNAYRHNGFWFAMDTLRDKNYLEGLWAAGKAPWKVWD